MSRFHIFHAPLPIRCVFLALAANFAFAYSGAAAAPSFVELEARLADHPSVQALRLEAEARDDLAIAEKSLPDPTISLGVSDIPVRDVGFRNDPDSTKMIGVEQDIPNPGVRRARSLRERGEAEAGALRSEYQISLLRAELIGALAEKESAKAQLGFAREKLKRYDELQEILGGELAAGRPIYFRLSQTDVERADVDRLITDLTSALARINATLIGLVGEAVDIAPPAVALTPWDGVALELHASRVADAGVEIAKAGVKEGKAAFGPNFGVGLTYMQRASGLDTLGMPFPGDDSFAAGVTISVPLWAPMNQAPRLRAARAREAAARSTYQTTYRDMCQELAALQAAHAAALRNIEIFQGKVASIGATIASARRNYEAGIADYVQILDAEIGRFTLLSELAEERARATTLAARFNSQLVTP